MVQHREPRWWVRDDYEFYRALDRPAFAWELLRRNARYKAEAASFARPLAAVVQVDGREHARATRWGVSFPRRCASRFHSRPRLLGRSP